MKNSKNQIFACTGINNAIALLGSNRFNIIRIDLLKGGRAAKSTRLKIMLKITLFLI